MPNEIAKLLAGMEITEAERLSEKFDIEVSRIEEGLKARDLIASMPKAVTPGSKWFVMDMAWVKEWQEYIYFDQICGVTEEKPSEEKEMPGPIQWTNIVKPTGRGKNVLQDNHKDF